MSGSPSIGASLWTSAIGDGLAEFLANAQSTVHIIAPFIKAPALERVSRGVRARDVVVIAAWRTADVLSGSSDLEVYDTCKRNGWYLYVNQILHAKLVVCDRERAVVMSANITSKALGYTAPENIECGLTLNLGPHERLWLARLLQGSTFVTDNYFNAFASHVAAEQARLGRTSPVPEFDNSAFLANREFLLSSLPMMDSPSGLLLSLEGLSRGGERTLDSETLSCVLHDAALFGLDIASASEHALTANFLGHPFTRAFTQHVEDRCFFGEAKEWLQLNCANVPVPRRRDLTGHVQILFRWIADLDPAHFAVVRPNYSECLVRLGQRIE